MTYFSIPRRALAPAIPTLALLLVFAPTRAAAQDAPRAMTVVDLIDLPSIGDPQLSPDGSQIVFTRSEADWDGNRTMSHVWRVDADGTDELQLTRGESGESSPRWSPDGARIAFLADRSDDQPRQIWLLRNTGGEAEPLTKHATSVGDIQWSPDGTWIYFTAPSRSPAEQAAREKAKDDVFAYDENYQQDHLWRVRVATGEEERLTEGDYSVIGYTLSRDGTMIAHHRAPDPLYEDAEKGEVWVMAADGSGARQLTDNGVTEGGAELSPDNRWVLFEADARADLGETYYNTNLFVVPAAGGAARSSPPAPDTDWTRRRGTRTEARSSCWPTPACGTRYCGFRWPGASPSASWVATSPTAGGATARSSGGTSSRAAAPPAPATCGCGRGRGSRRR